MGDVGEGSEVDEMEERGEVGEPVLPRLRQAVIAARDLDAVSGRLQAELGLAEPFSDPGVGYFGLRNSVFTLGKTFLEVVSPVRAGTSAGRLIDRRGGDCGYMLMFQVPELAAARGRASSLGIREVFDVELDDISEVHLHPADMSAAIVSISQPRPPATWRWGGPDWERRSAPLEVSGATLAVADPDRVASRWTTVLGPLSGVRFVPEEAAAGLVEIALTAGPGSHPRPAGVVLEIGRVRVVLAPTEHLTKETDD